MLAIHKYWLTAEAMRKIDTPAQRWQDGVIYWYKNTAGCNENGTGAREDKDLKSKTAA
jgi:hypothetical protein